MKIRFIKSFRAYRRGAVADLGDGEANVLIVRQIAVPEEQRTLLETAAIEPEARTAVIVKRKRGRPRKA
jgi:hypothetical protein